MSVLWFDGFEHFHWNPTFDEAGLDLGQHAYSEYWGKGSLGAIPTREVGMEGTGSYAIGIDAGLSSGVNIRALTGPNVRAMTPGGTGQEFRIGAFFKVDNYQGLLDPASPCAFFGLSASSSDQTILVALYPQGAGGQAVQARVNRYNGGLYNEGAIVQTMIAGDPITFTQGVWNYVELHVKMNGASSVVELKFNDSAYGSYTGALGPGAYNTTVNPHIDCVGSKGDVTWDHVWVSDGEVPVGNTTWAVAVALSGGGFQVGASTNTGFISIGTTLYKILPEVSSASISGLNTDNFLSPGDGHIYWPYVYWVFPKDPRDNSSWTSAKAAQFDSFGVCFTNTSGTGHYRITSISWQELWSNVGKPIVKVTRIGTNTAFNGAWIKTNSALSYAGHVQDVPPDTQTTTVVPPTDPADDQYLKTDTTGCIQFFKITNSEPFFGVGLTFAEEFDESYKDWKSVTNGTDYVSFFISGYKIHGQGDKKFESNYVTVNYEPTLSGSAFLQGVWDYANDPATGRWGVKQQVHKDNDTRYDHKATRLKVRGHGRALSFRVTSQSGHPFRLNGWTVFITGNQMV